ncbi:hypothetical protein QWI18_21960 [Pseudomonas sp. W2Oct36]|uniref:hypothetical protein n=1 Tax=Pseudomonas sp. W2Oct36 TaxID=1215284 RepID=UPI0012279900|nr:MAG: hypothetical protein EOP14_02350 [Pseudomonas sp.]
MSLNCSVSSAQWQFSDTEIKDENGKPVLSTIATGILSHDLFLNTLDIVLGVEEQAREPASNVFEMNIQR